MGFYSVGVWVWRLKRWDEGVETMEKESRNLDEELW